VGKVNAVMDASDQDLRWTPFDGGPGISENGQSLSQCGAELVRERLPWVGVEVSNGLNGSWVGCKDGDMPNSVLIKVQLGLAGGRDEGIYSGLRKHCNVWQFWIICSVVLYSGEIPLSFTERK
jgi:hypothetical protein